MTDEDYAGLNNEINHSFLSLEAVRQANLIMMYYSIAREVETISLIGELLHLGKKVGLPVCREDLSLEVRVISSLNQVVQREIGKIALFEPVKETPLIRPEVLDLIIIPGLAFDLSGNRLGHGAGYYDRFLHNIPSHIIKLGLAYNFQVIPEVPASSHDIPVDGLLTERNYFDFRL
jgi:5-formyltetrahydrofolate cyclo-ligase